MNNTPLYKLTQQLVNRATKENTQSDQVLTALPFLEGGSLGGAKEHR